MKANFDTLIILNCCNAGLAAVTELERPDIGRYRKELLGACAWKAATMGVMDVVMSLAIEAFLKREGDSVSISSLVRHINNVLALRIDITPGGQRITQAVHYVLQGNDEEIGLALPRIPWV